MSLPESFKLEALRLPALKGLHRDTMLGGFLATLAVLKTLALGLDGTMSSYTTPTLHGPHVEQHVERIVLALLATLAVLAVATGARVTWEFPGAGTSDAAPTAPAAAVERAARLEPVITELQGLETTTRIVPATQAVLADEIEVLRLVVDGNSVMAMSYYPNEAEPLWSKYSTHAIIHTLESRAIVRGTR